MKFIADLHIHSHYSIATSKQLVPEYLDYWAALKGIKVVGTGDFTHPGWTGELREKLQPSGSGLYTLKPDLRVDLPFTKTGMFDRDVNFMLSAEISTIYKKNGKVRKVHHVILAPDFAAAEGIQAELARRECNITSDGRPIIGLDSRDLLDLALSVSDRIEFIPAHIWTPWFSVLGSKSGFDTVDECYGDLASHIHAVETGLSADAPMLWINSSLDPYTLLSNSDAHSPEKLGRNCNRFDTQVSYDSIKNAIQEGDGRSFKGTIDLFPQEGKYHYDGHRKCGVCWNPLDTVEHSGICPKCSKQVTEGVMHRAAHLADRTSPGQRETRLPYTSIIPLKEILSELHSVGSGSKFIAREYTGLIEALGPELDVLCTVPLGRISEKGGALLAEAVSRMRSRTVYIQEGFDGQYGTVTLFTDEERKQYAAHDQGLLFGSAEKSIRLPPARKAIQFDLEKYNEIKTDAAPAEPETEDKTVASLNSRQKQAVTWHTGPCMVAAGPGTGKTRVLTQRIGHLIRNCSAEPSCICAVTFTNKAAAEMRNRLASFLLKKEIEALCVTTFHALGYSIITEHAGLCGRTGQAGIIEREDTIAILSRILETPSREAALYADTVSQIKQNPGGGSRTDDEEQVFAAYETYLREENLFDLDDLLYQTYMILVNNSMVLEKMRSRYTYLLVDEFQDINPIQYQLIRLLFNNTRDNVFVIGDSNQAIYGFRGADTRCMERFAGDYENAEIITLNQGYRCPETVLKAASMIIGDTRHAAARTRGLPVRLAIADTAASEAEYIARTIEQLAGGLRFFSMDSSVTPGGDDTDFSLSGCAVLCRTSRQFPAIEKAFTDHTIPYRKAGEGAVFQSETAKALVRVLRCIHTPGSRFLEMRMHSHPLIIENIEHSGLQNNGPVPELIQAAAQTCLDGEAVSRQVIETLASLAGRFENLEDFLRFASMGSAGDELLLDSEKVSLLTFHASKGLEFDCVILAGCEEGLMPYTLINEQTADVEEEKRLMYVGMTRTRKILYLTAARKRMLFGRSLIGKPSRLIASIDDGLIEHMDASRRNKPGAKRNQLKLF